MVIMFHYKIVQCKDGLYRYKKKDGSLSSKGYKTPEDLLRYESLKKKWLAIIIFMAILSIWILLTSH